MRETLKVIEGKLPARLQDGSLRLLRVAWLLEQPDDWRLQRRQDLPDAAFWIPAIVRLGAVSRLVSTPSSSVQTTDFKGTGIPFRVLRFTMDWGQFRRPFSNILRHFSSRRFSSRTSGNGT